MIVILFAWFSIAAFLGLIIIKFFQFKNKPVNLRWDLYPVPHEEPEKRQYGGSYMEELDWTTTAQKKSKIPELIEIGREVFYLKRLRDHNKNGLWIWSLMMHWGIYILLIWIGFMIAAHFFPALVVMIRPAGYISIILGLMGTIGLIFKRVTSPDLAKYSAPEDYFHLLVLLLVFGLGLISALDGYSFTGQQTYITNMLRFQAKPVPTSATAMFLTLQVFAIYMPFSKLIHYVMKHFAFTEILWDDQFKQKGSQLDERIKKQLDHRPGWNGAHFKGADRWADEVAIKPVKENQ